MRNSVSLVLITFVLVFSSCKKDWNYVKPQNGSDTTSNTNSNNYTPVEEEQTTSFSVLYQYPSSGLKSTVTGIVMSGDTVKIAATGNIAFWTEPATNCDWTQDGATVKTNIDQVLCNLTEDHKVYRIVATKTGSTESVAFYIKVNTDTTTVIPVIPGADNLIRLVSVEKVGTTKWALTWKAKKQINATSFSYYANWKNNYGVLNSFDETPIIGTDSIEFTFYMINSGLIGTRRTFIPTSSTGQWFSANSTACQFFDENYDTDNDGEPDNVFTFYFDAKTGKVLNADKIEIIPGEQSVVEEVPGSLGDTINAVNTAEIIGGNLVIYFKLPAGSTVLFQSSATASTEPETPWIHYYTTDYLITEIVPGSTEWSRVTIPSSKLSTYNWWQYGHGAATAYAPDITSMERSRFYIASVKSCRLIMNK